MEARKGVLLEAPEVGGVTAIVFDAGALIGIEKGKQRAKRWLEKAAKEKASVFVPASALAQVLRPGPRSARLFRLLAEERVVTLAPLDGEAAIAIGRLLAVSRTRDVVDAHAAVVAMAERAIVITSDERDLERLLPAGWPLERV